MKWYKVIYVDRQVGANALVEALEKGWKIERADVATDFIVYILYKEVC